jgi:hypothetical protein
MGFGRLAQRYVADLSQVCSRQARRAKPGSPAAISEFCEVIVWFWLGLRIVLFDNPLSSAPINSSTGYEQRK